MVAALSAGVIYMNRSCIGAGPVQNVSREEYDFPVMHNNNTETYNVEGNHNNTPVHVTYTFPHGQNNIQTAFT